MRQVLKKDLFQVEADLGQIEQVLLNLLVNAADAMPGGGVLTIRTMNVTAKNIVSKVYSPKPGDYVQIEVSDNGSGMDQETQQRIFEPFFSTKEMGRGTGLGLASVYGTVKGHGGYIEVESQKKKGTTFRIYLPTVHLPGRRAPAGESDKARKKAVKAAQKESRTILLVDDEEDIRSIGRDLLKALDYRVLTAVDGEEALEVYKKHGDSVVLVILDIVMPNMAGGETFDRLKAINPDVKVLVASGYSLEGEVSQILSRGAEGFIQKPFTLESLKKSIISIIEKKSTGH
jgi:CheY-like chemotaxis protein